MLNTTEAVKDTEKKNWVPVLQEMGVDKKNKAGEHSRFKNNNI